MALTWWNVNALYDAIVGHRHHGLLSPTAAPVCACAVYYRKELLKSVKNFFLIGVAPTVGAIMFAAILVKVIHDDYPYDGGNGMSYTGIHGIGGVFLMAVGTMLLGVVLMIAMWICEARVLQARARDLARRGRADPLRRRARQRVARRPLVRLPDVPSPPRRRRAGHGVARVSGCDEHPAAPPFLATATACPMRGPVGTVTP